MKPDTHLIFDHDVLCQHKPLVAILAVEPLIGRFLLGSLIRLLARGALTRLLGLYQVGS